MTSAPLKVVIVGAGAIGRIHAIVATESADLEVVAIVDRSRTSAESLADELAALGARPAAAFDTLDDALRLGADVVAICTPSGMHVALAEAAISAGMHVLIEKPLDVSLARARSFLAVAEEASTRGQVISVMSQHRFDPASVAVRDAIDRGGLGRITSAIASIAWWRSQGYYDSAAWRGTWAADGGGALMNQGVHTVDLLLWFLGRPTHVTAHTSALAHERIEVEDTAAGVLAFESGALAVLHATTAAFPGPGVRLQVMGSRGSAVIDNDELSYLHVDGDESRVHPMGLNGGGNQLEALPPLGDSVDATRSSVGHARQYEDLVQAIAKGIPPGVTVRDAFESLAAIHAAYVSAALGRTITFDDVVSGKYDDTLTQFQEGAS